MSNGNRFGLDRDYGAKVDFTAEFTGLTDDEAFIDYMYQGYDSFGLIYKQGSTMQGDSRFMPGLDDFFLFRGLFDIEGASAEMFDDGNNYHLVLSFWAGGQEYTLKCTKNEATLKMQGYDDSELIYRLDSDAVVRFILGLVHVNSVTKEGEITALPDGFNEYHSIDKLKIALSMLGDVTGITSIEHKKSVVQDDIDSSYMVSFVEASGIDFDARAVMVDMNWQLAEGRYTYVSIRSDERIEDGNPEFTSSGLRSPIEVSHLDFPMLHKLGLLGPLSPDITILLDPHKNYDHWVRAVNTVMSRLKHIYRREY